MTTRHLVDPELLPILDTMPAMQLNDEAVLQMREGFNNLAVLGDADAMGVIREEVFIPCANAPDVRCLVYRPGKSPAASSKDGKTLNPGYLQIHGGGYILGAPEMSDPNNLEICSKLGAVVVSVDYRLAPEYPIPAPLDDCYAALAWLHENAEGLKVDASRIGVGGESAGGGLAAALAIKARDEGQYAICHQHLTYPMLDDRTGTAEAPGDPLVGEFVWTRESNRYGWASYLGESPREAPQVPARAESLKGLPATWLSTAGLDLFRDENIEYSRRLMEAGVATNLVVYASAFHGFQGAVESKVNRRYIHDFMEALAHGLSAGQ